MKMIFLFNQGTGDAYLYLFIIIIAILLAPPIILFSVGLYFRKKRPKRAKILFIIGGLYLLIGLGICGSM